MFNQQQPQQMTPQQVALYNQQQQLTMNPNNMQQVQQQPVYQHQTQQGNQQQVIYAQPQQQVGYAQPQQQVGYAQPQQLYAQQPQPSIYGVGNQVNGFTPAVTNPPQGVTENSNASRYSKRNVNTRGGVEVAYTEQQTQQLDIDIATPNLGSEFNYILSEGNTVEIDTTGSTYTLRPIINKLAVGVDIEDMLIIGNEEEEFESTDVIIGNSKYHLSNTVVSMKLEAYNNDSDIVVMGMCNIKDVVAPHKTNELVYVRLFDGVTNFKELHSKLITKLNDVSMLLDDYADNFDIKANLYNKIDLHITDKFNSLFRKVAGITGLSIASFTGDFTSIDSYITKNYPAYIPIVKTLFKKLFISLKNDISGLDTDVLDALPNTDTGDDLSNIGKAKLIEIYEKYTCVYIKDIALAKVIDSINETMALTEVTHRTLYSVLANIKEVKELDGYNYNIVLTTNNSSVRVFEATDDKFTLCPIKDL